jgi:hypothetical protein
MSNFARLDASAEASFSVIIPACNEEAVIDRCLSTLLGSAPDGVVPEVIVVCNGCRDGTAARARRWPRVRVIELPVGSKPAALNAGNRAARATPRFFLDADVAVTYQALAASADALARPGVKTAAPRRRLELDGCSWLVRRYYHVWRQLPFARDGIGGCGVYGLSGAALAEIGEFPDVLSDDGFVRRRFARSERRSVSCDAFGRPTQVTVFPPRTAHDLLRVEMRRRQGLAELRTRYPAELKVESGPSSVRALTALALRTSLLDMAIYVGVKAAAWACLKARLLDGRGGRWLRDDSSRDEGSGTAAAGDYSA